MSKTTIDSQGLLRSLQLPLSLKNALGLYKVYQVTQIFSAKWGKTEKQY